MADTIKILEWIGALATVYAQNKEHLTDLDAAIGDGDHGINMDRGFSKAAAELEKALPPGIGEALKTCAMVLIKTVGGAAGPLYGTFFLRASTACGNKETLEPQDLAAMFRAGLEGVVQRGKAELGDKTMVDALTPAAEEMEKAAQTGCSVKETLDRGAAAARRGRDQTIPMMARKGRASYLKERSVGHMDPGAASSVLMIQTLAKVLGGSE